MPVPAGEDNPNRARGSGGKFHKEMEQPGPRPSTRARRCQSPRVRRSLRDGERKAAEYTKMAAVRLPPVRERKRPNGDGFSPRPMIRIKRGRLPEAACGRRRGRSPTGGGPGKGGAGGKTKAGETAVARLPAAPRITRTPDTRRRRRGREERVQRRARSPARNVTTRFRVGAGLGRAPSPASVAACPPQLACERRRKRPVRPAYIKRPPGKVFHTVENFFP